MPVEVVSNTIKRTRRTANGRAARAVKAGTTAATTTARQLCPVSEFEKRHLVDTIEASVRERAGLIEGEVRAGDERDPQVQHPWFVEAGTGVGFTPPEGVDAPPSTAPREWVYFNPYLQRYVTTSGNDPQPFMGPGYEAGRVVALRDSEGILG